MPRTHFFTGSGALCGTLAVVEWTEDHTAVSCPNCRALMHLSPAERRRAVFGETVPFTTTRDDEGGRP